MVTLTEILLNAQKTTDAALRNQAVAQIEAAEKGNAENFLGSLMQELSDETKPAESRALAGTLLKNFMASSDPKLQEEKARKWLAVPSEVRSVIKNMSLTTFASPKKSARLPAAAVAAAIAAIEVPGGQWQGVVANICKAARQTDNVYAREAALVSLTYLGEDCGGDAFMHAACEDIATTVVAAADDDNITIRVEGIKALCSSLSFFGGIMADAHQRGCVMRVICNAASRTGVAAASTTTRAAAMQCLVRVLELYYPVLDTYMQAVFSLTHDTIQRDDDSVVLHALEFWTTACDIEQYYVDDAIAADGTTAAASAAAGARTPRQGDGSSAAGGTDDGADAPEVCRYYVQGAAPYLVPVLWNCLMRQDEAAEPDEWNVCYAAAKCLQALAGALGDAVAEDVLPVITANLATEANSWRHVEAAAHALGCVLEGTTCDGPVGDALCELLPMLISLTAHPRSIVRNAAGWCLGRVCEHHSDIVRFKFLNDVADRLPRLLADDDPQAAGKGCYITFMLARSIAKSGDAQQTNEMSASFAATCQAVYNTATGTWNPALRKHAWEALAAVVGCAAADCAPYLLQLLPAFLQYLEETFARAAPNKVQEDHIWEIQCIFCCVVQALCRNAPLTLALADRIATTMLKLLESQCLLVRKDAIKSIGAMGAQLGTEFERYVESCLPHLLSGVGNYREEGMCVVALQAVLQSLDGIATAGAHHYESITVALLQNLKAQDLDPNVKPTVIAAFGDVALHAGERFAPFVLSVMKALGYASRVVLAEVERHPDNVELAMYLNDLRENMFTCYSGIVLGLRTQLQDPERYLHQMLQDLQRIAVARATTTPQAYINALNLAHDVVHVYKANMKELLLKSPEIRALIEEGTVYADAEVCIAADAVVAKMAKLDFLTTP